MFFIVKYFCNSVLFNLFIIHVDTIARSLFAILDPWLSPYRNPVRQYCLLIFGLTNQPNKTLTDN